MNFYSFPTGPINSFPVKARPAALCRAWRGLTVLLLAFGFASVLLSAAWAGDGALDPSFITGSGPYAGVQNIPEIHGNYGYPYVAGAPYNNYQLIFGTFYGINVGTNNFYQYNSVARLMPGGTLDTSFLNPQIYGWVRSVYIYPHNVNDPNSDKILVGGSFIASSGDNNWWNLARLKADGSLDTSFNPTYSWDNGTVNGVGVQGTGTAAKILVGGYNLQPDPDGGPRYQLVRLNADGYLDDTFTHWSAPGAYIYGMRVYSGDPVFGNEVRLWCTYPKHQDGSGGSYYMLLLDANAARPDITTPLASIGSELVDGPVLNLARQSDGKWIIVGQFKNVYNTANSTWVPRNRVARLNSDLSTLDLSHNVGVGPNASVTQIQPMKSDVSPYDDHMIIAGGFDTWNNVACGGLVRLNPTDGTRDNTFNSSGSGADDRIWRLNLNTNSTGGTTGTGGAIFGFFRNYNGSPRGCLAGLNADGSLNNSFANLSASAGGCGRVYSLAAQSDGKIIIGGDFNGVGGKYHGGIARINPDGSVDPSFIGGVDGMVRSVAVQADGKILLGGHFGGCNKWARTSLARLNPDGGLDTAFNPLLVGPHDNSLDDVYHVVPLTNGQIMIAGELYNASGPTGTPATRINSDGSIDLNFSASGFSIGSNWYYCGRIAPVSTNPVDTKYVIAGGYDTNMLGGGGFLTRLTSTGALDPWFYPTSNSHIQTTDGAIYDMLLQSDGKIVVSGKFTQIIDGAVGRSAIARFSANGSLDTTFSPSYPLPPNANTLIISAMARQPNGKILLEANLLNYLGNYNYNYFGTGVARLNANGSLDSNFSLGNLSSTSNWYYPGAGNSILRLPSGKALIGGTYTTYNGTAASSLVRIFASPANFSPGDLLLLLLD